MRFSIVSICVLISQFFLITACSPAATSEQIDIVPTPTPDKVVVTNIPLPTNSEQPPTASPTLNQLATEESPTEKPKVRIISEETYNKIPIISNKSLTLYMWLAVKPTVVNPYGSPNLRYFMPYGHASQHLMSTHRLSSQLRICTANA